MHLPGHYILRTPNGANSFESIAYDQSSESTVTQLGGASEPGMK
jgi:hypothetical protein